MTRPTDKVNRLSVFDYFAEEGGLESLHPGGPDLTLRCLASLGLPAGRRILDLACGPGAGLIALARAANWQVFGVDLSVRMVTLARRIAWASSVGERCYFVVGDVSRIPFGDAFFDAVLMECTLSSMPDKAAALAEMARVTRPGGWVSIHDMAWPEELPSAERACLAPLIKAEPETTAGWTSLFEKTDLVQLEKWDETAALHRFVQETEMSLNWRRRLGMAWSAYREAGLSGLGDLLCFARVYARTVRDGKLHYVVIRGQKRAAAGLPHNQPQAEPCR